MIGHWRSACVAPDGSRGILLGDESIVIPFGASSGALLRGSERAGWCALTGKTNIIAIFRLGTEDKRTTVAGVGFNGRMKFKHDFHGLADMSSSHGYVMASLASRGILIAESGQTQKRGSGSSARMASKGEFVVVDNNGTARWERI
jgi:hypothetical protein